MKTYQVEQFEIIARPAFNRVLLPKLGPEFNIATARVYLDKGSLTICDEEHELIFPEISERTFQWITEAGGVSVMNPDLAVHPKLAHIPLKQRTH